MHHTLGNTGIAIGEMGYGGMLLSIDGRPERSEAIALLHRAFDRGVRFVDTADAYCLDEPDKHHNEALIAEALQTWSGGNAEDILVATKGGLMRPEGRWTRNGDPEHIRAAIARSHRALGRPIDVWQHHAVDPAFALEDSLAPVCEAVNAGVIRYVGVSNYSVEQIERAQKIVDIVSVQNQYNPWVRNPENDGVLAYCHKHSLTFLPWSPLGGRHRVKGLSEFAPIARAAQSHSASPHRVVLAWLLQKNSTVFCIPGTRSVAHLEDCLAASQLSLRPEEIEALDSM